MRTFPERLRVACFSLISRISSRCRPPADVSVCCRGICRTASTSGGFTLLEALIALVIVGVSLGVLFQVVSGSINLSLHGRELFVITAEAQAVFDAVAPRSLPWEELEWSNSTETGEWTLTLHPVILRDAFERTGVTGGQDLFKLVFDYRDLASDRAVRLFAYRREPQDRLRVFLEKNREHVAWDEHDRFAEFLTP